MDPSEHHPPQEQMVRLTLDLPVSIVACLDQVQDQAGLRSRGALVPLLLKELSRGAGTAEAESGKAAS